MYSEKAIFGLETQVENVSNYLIDFRQEFNKEKRKMRDVVRILQRALMNGNIPEREGYFGQLNSIDRIYGETAYGGTVYFSDSDDNHNGEDLCAGGGYLSDSEEIFDDKTRRGSKFAYKDLSNEQIKGMDEMFAAVDPKILEEILKDPLDVRRTKAIAKFCNVDEITAGAYLRKNDFNPEPVIEQIDEEKTKKYSLIWYLSNFALVLAVVYFIGMKSLPDYISMREAKIWTVSYEKTEQEPTNLPIIIISIQGINSSLITPYTISMKKATDVSAATHEYCSPQFFPIDCWGNKEDAMVCANDLSKMWYLNSSDYTWSVCRDLHVERALCPSSWPVMCNNPYANMGIEPVCENHEICAIQFFGGPKTCPDGRDLASTHWNPTSCQQTIEFIPNSHRNEPANYFDFSNHPRVYRFQTLLILIPPNETLAHTREEYYASFRFIIDKEKSASDDTTQYALRFQAFNKELMLDHGVRTWKHVFDFFYDYPDGDLQDLQRGSRSTMYLDPTHVITSEGIDKTPIVRYVNTPDYFVWYHSAISIQLSTNKITVNEEKSGLGLMNGFIGPAGGFICLLLRIQSAILLIVLTGISIPCPGGTRHFFGWKINDFDASFRIKMMMYNNIYDPNVADGAEGEEMLAMRSVTWPTNEVRTQKGNVINPKTEGVDWGTELQLGKSHQLPMH